jgi:hypothetical protein
MGGTGKDGSALRLTRHNRLLHHLGQDRARTDRVDADAVRNECDRHHRGELLKTAFRNGVSNRSRVREDGIDGRHVDDRAALPLRDHRFGGRLADEKRRLQIHALHAIECVFREIDKLR